MVLEDVARSHLNHIQQLIAVSFQSNSLTSNEL